MWPVTGVPLSMQTIIPGADGRSRQTRLKRYRYSQSREVVNVCSLHQPATGKSGGSCELRVADGDTHDAGSELISLAELQQVALKRKLSLSLKELGPFYRVTVRDVQGDKILAVTSGFVAPLFGLMHCDLLQVFTRGLQGAEGDRVRGGSVGLGLLVGAAVFSHGHSCGCRTAEILAINDDEYRHQRLVRYYQWFGFEAQYEVGGRGLADLPDMLVWGGAGTRLNADVARMLRKWTPALRRSSRGDGADR